jgi:hypothetical protein
MEITERQLYLNIALIFLVLVVKSIYLLIPMIRSVASSSEIGTITEVNSKVSLIRHPLLSIPVD